MPSSSVRQSLCSVLISTRPPREKMSRPLFVAALGHVIVLGVLVAATDTYLPVIVVPREIANLDKPPVLIQLTDAVATRAAKSASLPRTKTAKAAPAGLPLAPALALPNLAEVESALAAAADSLMRAFENGTWARPEVPRGEATVADLATLANGPRVTIYSRAPWLINRNDIKQFLSDKFPWRLREMGGQAQTMLWLLIDTTGHVHKAEVQQTSGQVDVDTIALAATHKMLFRPAEHGGRVVPVWVQMPVAFRVE